MSAEQSIVHAGAESVLAAAESVLAVAQSFPAATQGDLTVAEDPP